jgi:hypothetical protein
MSLQFFPVGSISLNRFESEGHSSLKMWDDHGSIRVLCDGAMQLSMTCGFLYVQGISGLMVEGHDDN